MRLSSQVDLPSYAAAARWTVEAGGIDFGGATLATDRSSQAMIIGLHAFVRDNPAATIKFKALGGFVELDAATATAAAQAVGQHVQRCFAREAEVVAAIAAGTITTPAEIDAAFADVAEPWSPA